MRRIAAVLIGFLALLTGVAEARLIYVSPGGNHGAAVSWGSALTNLQSAFDLAQAGDTIVVIGHTFALGDQISWTHSGVTLEGGYEGSGTPGTRDPVRWPTVITRAAGADSPLLRVDNVTNGVLDGVTLRNGDTTSQFGAGLYVTGGSLTVTNCAILENRVSHGSASGAGIAAVNCDLLITDSLIAENFTHNGTGHRGAGLFISGGTNRIEHSVIANNYSIGLSSGDGIYLAGSATELVVFNSLVTGNHRDGIRVQDGRLQVYNSTVTGHGRYGMHRNAGTAAVTNSILTGNHADTFGTVFLGYCLLGDATAGIGDNDNIGGDPLFELGLYLADGSPAIDAGSESAAFRDLDGRTTRTNGVADADTVDLGYHFRIGAPVTFAERRAGHDPVRSDLYVSPAGDDGNDGMSAPQAFRSITRALAVAPAGGRIHVAAGMYTNGVETFPLRLLNYGVLLLGAGADDTVVSAAGTSLRVMEIIGALGGGGRIEGLTLTGGAFPSAPTYSAPYETDNILARRGGGLMIANSQLVMDSVTITNNTLAGRANEHLMGGGIYSFYSRIVLTNSVVANNRFLGSQSNTGGGYGGGLYLLRGHWEIVDTVISNNQASFGNNGGNYGGGVYMAGSAHRIRRSTIVNNRVTGGGSRPRFGGGVYMISGTIEDCLITTNWMTTTTSTSAQGGGIYMTGGRLRNSLLTYNRAIHHGGAIFATGGMIENVTAAGNRAVEANRVAGVVLSGEAPAVTNSMFYANTRDFDGVDVSINASGGTIGYSCTNPERDGTGNTGADPEFADADGGDYRLRPGSPAIDTALELDWMADAIDRDGNPRIRNGVPDMGVYESEPPDEGDLRINFIADQRSGKDSLEVVFTAHVAGANTNGLTYSWDFQNNGSFDQEGPDRRVVTNIYVPGFHSVRLRVVNAVSQEDELIKTGYIRVSSSEIYVWSGGDNSDGTSWARAFKTVQAAIDLAGETNVIYLAGETVVITESLVWADHDSVSILGGYEGVGSPGNRNPATWPTVIRRDAAAGNFRIMDIVTVNDCLLDGITIADGNTPTDAVKAVGGGLRVFGSTLFIEGCVLTNNQSNASGNGYVWGGGIYAQNSTLTVRNTLFTNNRARSTPSSNNNRAHGGGLASENSTVTVLDCEFFNNAADAQGHHGSRGGALYLAGGSGLVSNTTMIANWSGQSRTDRGRGGAVYLHAGTLLDRCTIVSNRVWNAGDGHGGGGLFMEGGVVRNSQVAHNRASWDGGAIFASGGVIENVTAAGNRNAEAGRIAGVFLSGANPTVTNSIFYANYREFDGLDVSVSGTGGTLAYSCTFPERSGTDNTGVDPEFTDAANGDFRLRPGSPAIDTALTLDWMAGAVDLDGQPRVRNGVPDMGAYEAAGAGEGPLRINFVADQRQGMDSLEVVFTATVAGVDTSGLSYSWDFENTGSFDIEGGDLAVVTNIYAPGTYAVRLRVVNAAMEQDELIKSAYIFVSSSTIYVSSSGDDSDGTSWARAFTTLQAAIDAAGGSNTIHIAGETFVITETLVWSGLDSVSIQGGYEGLGMPGNRDPAAWPTVIRRDGGAGNFRVMDIVAVTDGRLDGVTIADGNTPTDGIKAVGGGLRVLGASLEIVDCVFSNNQSNASGNGYVWGGGIYAQNSVLTVSRSVFFNNRAKSTGGSNNNRAHGGGLAAENSTVTVLNGHFIANDADAQGHHGSRGGAIYLVGGSGVFRNTFMIGNRAGPNRALGQGGGIYVNAGTVLENATVVSNRVWHTGTTAGGIYAAGGAVSNSIAWHNENLTTSESSDAYSDSWNRFAFSCAPELPDGVNGNLTADPLFIDPAAGNYRLRHESSSVDSGALHDWMLTATDLDGRPRVLWGVPPAHGGGNPRLPDRGAYETPPLLGSLLQIR